MMLVKVSKQFMNRKNQEWRDRMKSRGGFASLLLLSVVFFLISLVEAIQPIPWWSILFLHCELYHHLLRLPLPDNSLIMMLTVPPLMQRIFWRPFFSSVPPISTPLHARQELNLELYFLLVMFFLGCFWIDQFSVDGTGTWQGSLEKAKTRTGAHIHDE